MILLVADKVECMEPASATNSFRIKRCGETKAPAIDAIKKKRNFDVTRKQNLLTPLYPLLEPFRQAPTSSQRNKSDRFR